LNRHDAWRTNPAPTNSSIFSRSYSMSELLTYGRMAETHWRQHCPRLVQRLEQEGRLQEMLLEAQARTQEEMDSLIRQFRQQGLSPQQAHDQAWELVREKYLLLSPEPE
jgi:hypothetical protein